MASYEPPIVNLPIFDTLVFNNEEPLTLATASRYFLRYPFAQGFENLQSITVQKITQIAGYDLVQSGTSIINQSGTGTNTLKDSTIPALTVNTSLDVNGTTTCQTITQDANYSLNQSGTGVITQAGTGTNTLKDSTIPALTVNTSLDVNGATTCQTITQDANYSLNQSGTGIINQTGTSGTNALKSCQITSANGATSTGTVQINDTVVTKELKLIPNASAGAWNAQVSAGDQVIVATGSAADNAVLFLGTWSSTGSGCGVRITNNQVVVRGGTNTVVVNATAGVTVNSALDVNGATTCQGITQDANSSLNQSGTGVITQAGTGTNTLKNSTIPVLTVNTSLDVNGPTTCQGITQDANFSLNQSGTGVITQAGTGTNTLKSTNINGYVGQTITGSGNYQYGDNQSLSAITTGTDNIALGFNTLRAATTATTNVAIGSNALASKVSGVQCIAIGPSAMGGAVSSVANTIAIGASSAAFCGGNANVAIGVLAQQNATTAYNSVAIGFGSLQNNNEYQTTAIGRASGNYGYGNNNVFLGYNTGQASTDFTPYTYLTCIGSGSGGADCNDSRVVLGSATGNEHLFMAGDPIIYSRAVTDNPSLFPNVTSGIVYLGDGVTTGGVSIGNNITTGSITIGSLAGAGIITIGSTSVVNNLIRGNTITLETASAGIVNVGDNLTTGTIYVGDGVTAGVVTIGNNITTGSITIGSLAGAGSITIGSTSVVNNLIRGNTITLESVAAGNIVVGGNITTGTVYVGNGITTGVVTIADTMAASGSVLICENATGGQITIGSTSTNTDIYGTTTTITCAAGGVADLGAGITTGRVDLGKNITTGTIKIMDKGTTGNLELHNPSASGTGRIHLNRGLRLPDSTTFATPAAGELGYTPTATNTQASVTSGTSYNLGSISLGVGVWMLTGTFSPRARVAGAGTVTRQIAMFSTVSATLTALTNNTGRIEINADEAFANSQTNYESLSATITNTATTTIYLVGQITFSSGSFDLRGDWAATRVA